MLQLFFIHISMQEGSKWTSTSKESTCFMGFFRRKKKKERQKREPNCSLQNKPPLVVRNEWVGWMTPFCIWTRVCLRGKNKSFWQNGTDRNIFFHYYIIIRLVVGGLVCRSYGCTILRLSVLFLFLPSLARSFSIITTQSLTGGGRGCGKGRGGCISRPTSSGLQTMREGLWSFRSLGTKGLDLARTGEGRKGEWHTGRKKPNKGVRGRQTSLLFLFYLPYPPSRKSFLSAKLWKAANRD